MQPKVKAALHEIWMASTRKDAYNAFDNTLELFSSKYPKAMECLSKDREELLAFYDFPAEHWIHIRTTNPIESAFELCAYVQKNHAIVAREIVRLQWCLN